MKPADLSHAHHGVYCLANDEVIEWFRAFVRSFRKWNPTLPLTVIPYNSSIEQLEVLSSEFCFSIMDEANASHFDSHGRRVVGPGALGNTYRKLSCFIGGYDAFIFLDSDIVVTSSLEPLLIAFEQSSVDFVYFDTDITMVYKPDFAAEMIEKFNSPGFNSGAFMARRDSITEAEIYGAMESGEKVRDHFVDLGEQPFFNYLFDISARRLAHARELISNISEKPWARIAFHHDRSKDQYIDSAGRLMPFVHWPGCEFPTMVRSDVFLHHRVLGMNSAERTKYVCWFFYLRLRRKIRAALARITFVDDLIKNRGPIWRGR